METAGRRRGETAGRHQLAPVGPGSVGLWGVVERLMDRTADASRRSMGPGQELSCLTYPSLALPHPAVISVVVVLGLFG